MSLEAAVHAQAIELGRMSLEMCAAAGSGHPTTALSLAHLTTVLMYHSMRWSPDFPDYPTSDRLVLSEGHAVPIVYAAACKLGVVVEENGQRRKLTPADANTLREQNSTLDGHPNPRAGFPFFDAATGSLGQGLSVAAGLGEAARMDSMDKRVYCIIGDGESREGQIAEAMDIIAERGLSNVLAIFNCNEYGQSERVSGQQTAETLKKKLEAYGFDVTTIDGHSPDQIIKAMDAFAARSGEKGKPMAVVAKTVKGWGVPSIQGGGWHGKPPVGEALTKALGELDEKRLALTTTLSSSDSFEIQPPAQAPESPDEIAELPGFTESMRQYDMESLLHTGKLATRKAYGVALRALGHAGKQVVALDADVKNSTFAEMFAKDSDLADRFVECKIAEQNMVSMAAGMAAAGKIPFVSTFSKFFARAYDQIEMAIYSGANVKFIGSHSGVTLAADGPSQMSLPDVAWFRSFATARDSRGNPACYVLQPADAYAAYALTQAMAEYEGVCYMRTTRPEAEFIYSDDTVFNLGGMEVLTQGRDVAICASGYMVHEANRAIDLLDEAGVSATLVDMYSLPFDEDKLLDIISQNGGYVVSVEDNFGGAMGSAIADAMVRAGDAFQLEQLHVTQIPKSARTAEELLQQCGLTAQHIKQAAMRVLQVV